MPNWFESMQQTFEYYTVDPGTWKDVRKINTVKSCKITWDSEAETLGSATMDVSEDLGEVYIRVYLVTIQNGVTEKHVLGTFLVQTPSFSFDGRTTSISVDAYTPLLELKEKQPPIGYFVMEKENIMDAVYRAARENLRAPVVKPSCDETLFSTFVANIDDTWLTCLSDLMSNAKYIFSLDETGRILFAPKQDMASLQAVTTFDDGNSSILYPDISRDNDLYGIPNVVEVKYSDGSTYYEEDNGDGTTISKIYEARVVNDDPNSPISTIRRGREIVYRVTDPNMIGNPTEDRIIDYAKQLLRELSTVEHTLSYTHGYYPVRVGDCVRLNYSRAGINNVKAKIISQTISCEPGCPVTEKAVYTTKLWG